MFGLETLQKSKNTIIACCVCLLLGASVGFFSHQPKEVTKTITQTVIQTVEVEKKVDVQDHTQTNTVIDKKADGEEITTITTKNDVDTKTDTSSKTETKSSTTEQDKTVVSNQADYSVGAYAKFKLDQLAMPTYEVSVGRRLAFGLWAEGSVDIVAKTAGIGLRLEF